MTAKVLINARIDEQIKEEATFVLAAMGLTISDACRILFTRIAEDQIFPVELLTPSPQRIEEAKLRAQKAGKKAA